jgi:putative ABC transport system permease protein
MRNVTKAFLRYLPRRRGLSFLQLLGIACGVAATVGMVFSARSALSNFTHAVEFLRGKATHSLERPAGPMEEALLVRLMKDPAVKHFSPVVDRRLILPDGEPVRVLGIDPFLDRAVRPEILTTRTGGDQGRTETGLRFLLQSDAVFVEVGLARRLGVVSGDLIHTSRGPLQILDVFPNPSGEPLILMDIGHAQKLFALGGLLDRVDLVLSDPHGFRLRWQTGFLLQSNRQQQASFADMLRAFRLNLEALSLLALFVGVFLVYNTAMFAVVSRRKDAGILRALGATRSEIVLAFLAEVLLLGISGGLLGSVLGYLLSRGLTEIVGDTISRLYFSVPAAPPPWSPWILAFGAFLGLGASLLGGILPLRELLRTDPVRSLQGRTATEGSGRGARKAALVGLGVLAVSFGLLPLAEIHVYVGFAGAFGLLLGASFLTGRALLAMQPVLKGALGGLGGLPGRMAAGNISRNLGRTAVAVAAFMVALAMSVGLGSMIGSFRETLTWWMDSQLRGDLYIAPSREIEVPEDFLVELRGVPGIGGLDPYRNTQISYQGSMAHVSAVDAGVLQKYARFGWLRGGDENWDPVKRGSVIVSESFSRRFGVSAGSSLPLDGIRGPTRLPVAQVFYDYTTEHGLIMMDRSTYLDVFGDPTIDALVVFVDKENPQKDSILEDVRRRARSRGLPVSTQSEFHASILQLFDATFAVTRSMRIIAVVVAFFGIAGAILTLFMERRRDFGIYRALGFSTPQVAAMTLMEGLGMGGVSFALSVLVGTALGWILIRVINVQSFHWTIFFHFDWDPYLLTGLTALLASVGAALYPIWKVCRTYPQMQIREE